MSELCIVKRSDLRLLSATKGLPTALNVPGLADPKATQITNQESNQKDYEQSPEAKRPTSRTQQVRKDSMDLDLLKSDGSKLNFRKDSLQSGKKV